MPVISRFFGVVVSMYYADHSPPHFHARYGEHQAIVGIDPIMVLRGELPPRVAGLVLEWAARRHTELIEDWTRARHQAELLPIEPLE